VRQVGYLQELLSSQFTQPEHNNESSVSDRRFIFYKQLSNCSLFLSVVSTLKVTVLSGQGVRNKEVSLANGLARASIAFRHRLVIGVFEH
jgi:hypothetical protein